MSLSADRNTPRREDGRRNYGMATNIKIYGGALVMLNAGGYATKGAAATGQIAAGRAEETVDNTGGANGDKTISVLAGEFKYKNSASGDAITIAEIGDNCYIVDDETVAKTDGSATRSVAGKITGVDSDGVWVQVGF